MVRLVIRCGRKELGEYLIEGEVTTIGRGRDNTLCLEDGSVSRQHARIKRDKDKYIIEDSGSRNGTFVNGKRVSRQNLQSEDRVEVGGYILIFQERPTVIEKGETTIDKKGRPVPLSEPMTGPGLIIIRGANTARRFPVGRQELRIGRAEGNDIVLLNDTISRNHAKIVRKEGKVILKDLGSQNGIVVNGKKVKEKNLKDGDEIEIGPISFKFVEEGGARIASKKGNKASRKALFSKKFVLIAVSVPLLVVPLLILLALYLPSLIGPSPGKASTYIKEGNDLYNLGKCKKSIVAFEEAIKIDPQSAEAAEGIKKAKTELTVQAYFERGKEYYDSGYWVKAAIEMNRVLKISANHGEAKIYLQKIRQKVSLEKTFKEAVGYCQAGKWSKGVEKLEKILSIDPENLEAERYLEKAKQELSYINLYNRGVDLFGIEEYARSIEEFSKIPGSNNNYLQAQDFLAKAKKKLGAKESYDSGMAFYRVGDVDKARVEFRKALNLDPGSFKISSALTRMESVLGSMKRAEQLRVQGKVIEASQEWRMLLRIETDPRNYFYRLALRRQEELQPQLRKLAEEYFAKGLSYQREKNLKEAGLEFTLALKAQPDYAEAGKRLEKIKAELNEKAKYFYEQGVIYEEWGDKKQAGKNFEQVLNLVSPDNDYYRKAKKKLKRY